MKDRYGRTIDYMRISITDRCNLRCRYCMPDGIEKLPMSGILTYEEICELCVAAADCGIRRFRITGGEPLVRRGCAELVSLLAGIPQAEEILMTTNGILLAEQAEDLASAGLSGVNISLDTLNPGHFAAISGRDGALLRDVLRGIDAALEAGLRVKLNTVLQEGLNADEWPELLAYAGEREIDVRFIEMMPIGYGAGIPGVGNDRLAEEILRDRPDAVWTRAERGSGPAVYLSLPGRRGRIGFISAMHGPFCASCNRLRLTSTGRLKSCLCYDTGIETRQLFAERDPVRRRAALAGAVREAIEQKPERHCFSDPERITEKRPMTDIGG